MVLPRDEIARPTHRRSFSFYLALVLVVIPVYAILPLSWLYATAFVAAHCNWIPSTWTAHIAAQVVFAYALIEALFSVWYLRLHRQVTGAFSPLDIDIHVLRRCLVRVLQAGLVRSTLDASEKHVEQFERHTIYERLAFDDPRAVDFRDCLRTWFKGVPFSELRRNDVYAWLYWATYGLSFPGLQSLDEVHKASLQDALQLLQNRIGCEIPEGSNVSAFLLRLDPLSAAWRPAILYSLFALGNKLLRSNLVRTYEMVEGRWGELDYLLRIPSNWEPSNTKYPPIVFLHGLGIGMLQYQSTIVDLLQRFSNSPILIVRQPSISQDIFHKRHLQPMDKDEMVESLHGLLLTLGWTTHGVTVVSHSNGSIPHAWMIKEHPTVIRRSLFIDPVVFCLWEGDVCHNFVYRPPTDALTLLMRYMVGTELGIANTIQRRFNWADNTLWFEDIPQGHDPRFTRFYLGGKDAIVASERVRNYLLNHGVIDGEGVVFNPKGRHGEAILTNSSQLEDLFAWLRDDPLTTKFT